jgi:hypothetical protein
MIAKRHTLKGLSSWIGLFAVVAAFASTSAFASPGAGSTPDPWLGYAQSLTQRAANTPDALARFITDTLGGNGGVIQAQGYRFTTDTLATGGGSAQPEGYRFTTDTLAPGGGIQVAAPTVGFDWSDAGVGAVASAGSLLILLGGAFVLLQGRRRLAV